MPPTCVSASSTTPCSPRWARTYAAVSPAGPPPSTAVPIGAAVATRRAPVAAPLEDGDRPRGALRELLGELRIRYVDRDRRAACGQGAVDGLHGLDDVETELRRRPRRRPVEHGAAEVEDLERQRLGRLDLRRDDVAGPVRQLELAERLRVGEGRARVEDPHRLTARVVVHDHLLRADDRRPPQLARREPGELQVRDRTAVEPRVDERDVRRVRDHAARESAR